jgi:4a-hydroxytetrahydrobiopterin dehydratase
MDLASKKCIPCAKGTPPLKGAALQPFTAALPTGWEVVDEHYLQREFTFKNFQQALDFTNKVGAIAEGEHHHPDIYLSWGKVRVELSTHKIGGLSENDFILAAKISKIIIDF